MSLGTLINHEMISGKSKFKVLLLSFVQSPVFGDDSLSSSRELYVKYELLFECI